MVLIFLIVSIHQTAAASEGGEDSVLVPVTTVFDGIGRNTLGSFEYNYGLNYFVAAAGTYGIVESGFDWRWYRNAQDHPWIPNAGFVAVGVGPLVSFFAPLGLYLYGRSKEDDELQMTGLALGQAAILGVVVSSAMKAFTGRVAPDEHNNLIDNSREFRFGFLRGGIFHGWPSSHTCTAFAMAVTLTRLYPDNSTIKIASLTYASLIGLGVSTNIHWFSEAFAGALVGYAIGASVGDGFWNLMRGESKNHSCNIHITPAGVGLTYRF